MSTFAAPMSHDVPAACAAEVTIPPASSAAATSAIPSLPRIDRHRTPAGAGAAPVAVAVCQGTNTPHRPDG